MQLDLTDSHVSLKPNWFERLLWGGKEFVLLREHIESVKYSTIKPATFLCRKNRVANIHGVLSVGLFFPDGLDSSELWSFSYKHDGVLKIAMKRGEIAQYVIGMSQAEGQEWCRKISEVPK